MKGQEMASKRSKKEIETELLSKMEEDSGHGIEGADSDCFAVSFLTILQDLSPQVKKKNAEYIKGAESGMLMLTATGEIFDGDEGIEIVQVGFERIINIWRPGRAGFAGRMKINDPRYLKAKPGDKGTADEFKVFDEDGNELADTRNHFIFILREDGGFDPVVMSCSHSKIKASNKFMAKLRGLRLPRSNGQGKFNPPTFAFSYRVRTTLETNNRGQEYYNFTVPELVKQVVDPEIYEESRTNNKQITAGKYLPALPAAALEDDSTGM